MTIAYDLDGTLARTDYGKAFGTASLVGMLEKAPVIYKPSGEFIIITARGENTAVQHATRAWVKDNLPGCQGVYFTTGSGKPGMERKLAVMHAHSVTEFVDSKKSNLAILKELDPSLKLAYISDGKKVSY
jgi:hypothetical protein